jgi:hypothetical protein
MDGILDFISFRNNNFVGREKIFLSSELENENKLIFIFVSVISFEYFFLIFSLFLTFGKNKLMN